MSKNKAKVGANINKNQPQIDFLFKTKLKEEPENTDVSIKNVAPTQN
jgi:hypothetical protein